MRFKKSISINFNQFLGDMLVISMSKMGKKCSIPKFEFCREKEIELILNLGFGSKCFIS